MSYLQNFKSKDDFYSFVSSRIKNLRETLNCIQDYVSEKIDMLICNYAKIEHNKSKCPLYALIGLCDLFNMTIDEFSFVNNKNQTKLQSTISKMSNEQISTVINALNDIAEYYKINKK